MDDSDDARATMGMREVGGVGCGLWRSLMGGPHGVVVPVCCWSGEAPLFSLSAAAARLVYIPLLVRLRTGTGTAARAVCKGRFDLSLSLFGALYISAHQVQGFPKLRWTSPFLTKQLI